MKTLYIGIDTLGPSFDGLLGTSFNIATIEQVANTYFPVVFYYSSRPLDPNMSIFF